MHKLTLTFLLGVLVACSSANSHNQNKMDSPTSPDSLTYLALGDSYTIGEAVPPESSFPFQLVGRLKAASYPVSRPDVIAVTGWTTGELKQGIADRNLTKHNYDFVTLLIGVNNQFRGYSKEEYRAEFTELLNTALKYAGGNKQHALVLSIPDWGVTPFGQNGGYNPPQIASEIDAFNAINKEESEKAGIKYIDITPSSRLAPQQPDLIATDGLHPSGKMYSLWVDKLLPMVKQVLGQK